MQIVKRRRTGHTAAPALVDPPSDRTDTLDALRILYHSLGAETSRAWLADRVHASGQPPDAAATLANAVLELFDNPDPRAV